MTACPECPFRRTSAPGYLGSASYDPDAFINPHWYSDLRLPCHMRVDWEAKNIDEQVEQAGLCEGFLIMSANSCKLHFNTEVRAAQELVNTDRENFFTWFTEFCEHHRRDEHGL